ncbi:MAG: hypothetical protein AMXMBFR7_04820 [Planctomycetota bacterium]
MKRATAIWAACLLPLLLSGCGEDVNRYRLLMAERVAGKTYLLAEYEPLSQGSGQSYFAVYTPRGGDPASWQLALEDRTGPVFGTFVYRDPQGVEQLGLLHPTQANFYTFGDGDPQVVSRNIPFKWWAETGAQLSEQVFLFGGDFAARKVVDGKLIGRLAVAAFDGGEIKELELSGSPPIQNLHFWLRAVPQGEKIHVFWREAEVYGTLDFEPPVRFVGPLREAVFDGAAFEDQVREYELPQGYTTVWSDGGRIRAAVQPVSREFGQSPPPRLFTLDGAGGVEERPLSFPAEEAKLRFKYFLVERLPGFEEDLLVRSNSQQIQLWRATPEGWQASGPLAGLPVYGVERVLLGLLACCVATVAAGLGLAWRRRRQLQYLVEKLKPSDVLAPLSLRLSAHMVDLAAVVLATEVVTRLADMEAPRWSEILLSLQVLPPFFVLYVVYLALAEWLTGSSLGKWLLGLRVVTDRGERPGLYAAFVRNLVGYYERHPLLAPFAALPTIVLTPKHQRLGDLLAHTLVVQKSAMDRYKSEREAELARVSKPPQGTDSESRRHDPPRDSGLMEKPQTQPLEPPSPQDPDDRV